MKTQENRKELMNFLLKSQPVVLITTGRTGSDFLQSLFDSHSKIMVFNGHLVFYYKFWKSTDSMRKNTNCMTEDIVYKFVCKFMIHLKSYYDENERKHRLGSNRDQSLIINLGAFIDAVCLFMENFELNSKNFLVAIYAAYSELLGHDLTKKCVLFHHMHNTGELKYFIEDFSNTKIISMTRDPRANYYSGIEHRIVFYKNKKPKSRVMTCWTIHWYIERLFIDSYRLEKYKCHYVSLRLEDLGRQEILEKISRWMGVDFEDTMNYSTWGGLAWGGDNMSPKFNTKIGFSSDMINNKWHDKLSSKDKFIFNILLNSRLKHYGYDYKDVSLMDMIIAPFLILLPMELEYRVIFTRNFIRIFKPNIIGYVKRVILFYKYYFKELMGQKFDSPFIS
jgi:hypothetical protein